MSLIKLSTWSPSLSGLLNLMDRLKPQCTSAFGVHVYFLSGSLHHLLSRESAYSLSISKRTYFYAVEQFVSCFPTKMSFFYRNRLSCIPKYKRTYNRIRCVYNCTKKCRNPVGHPALERSATATSCTRYLTAASTFTI